MKENKSTKIDIRISQEEKERFKAFAAERDLSLSELVRMALNYIVGGQK